MKGVIIAIFIIIFALGAHATEIKDISYSIKINFDEINVNADNVKLVEGVAAKEDKSQDLGYRIDVISFKNEKLSSKSFNLPIYWDDSDEVTNNGSFYLFLPYNTNAQKLEIYKENTKISERDISDLASCNQDKFCSDLEDAKNCPEDCTIENAEPETQTTITKEAKPAAATQKSYLIITVILLLISGIILFIYLGNRGKK